MSPTSTSPLIEPKNESCTHPIPASPAEATQAPFVWGVGIECSFLPHIDVDQFDWTQHNRFWREDLTMVRQQLGVTHMRYALPWHKIETSPGVFDWGEADERIAFCGELGIELM